MVNIRQQKNCDACEIKCELVKSLNNREYNSSDSFKRDIVYKKGETIFKQSSYISHIAFVRSGLIKIVAEGANNKNFIVKFIEGGQYIGLEYLFNKNYINFTATVVKNSDICLIDKEKLSELVLNNNELTMSIFNLLSADNRFLTKRLNVMGTKQLHGRLATAILNLTAGKWHKENVFPSVTKKELAEYSGMSPESLMRLLNEFKLDRIVLANGKDIKINDYDILVKLSQIG